MEIIYSLGTFLILVVIGGSILTIPLAILLLFEIKTEKKLLILHILYNSFFIIYPIYFHYSTRGIMMHAPPPEFLLVPAYPFYLLFYTFGISLTKHYLTEKFTYVRYALILLYSLYTAIIAFILFNVIFIIID